MKKYYVSIFITILLMAVAGCTSVENSLKRPLSFRSNSVYKKLCSGVPVINGCTCEPSGSEQWRSIKRLGLHDIAFSNLDTSKLKTAEEIKKYIIKKYLLKTYDLKTKSLDITCHNGLFNDKESAQFLNTPYSVTSVAEQFTSDAILKGQANFKAALEGLQYKSFTADLSAKFDIELEKQIKKSGTGKAQFMYVIVSLDGIGNPEQSAYLKKFPVCLRKYTQSESGLILGIAGIVVKNFSSDLTIFEASMFKAAFEATMRGKVDLKLQKNVAIMLDFASTWSTTMNETIRTKIVVNQAASVFYPMWIKNIEK